MKTLIAGVVLIVVLGVGGFLYRNVLEHPSAGPVAGTACTTEAKLCPDGTAVGRTGPDCAFAACAAPNVLLNPTYNSLVNIAFALPDGYVRNDQVRSTDVTLIAEYDKNASSSPLGVITIRDYWIKKGQTADDTIVANTTFEPSDMPAADMSKFAPKIIGTRTFSEVTIERYEGVVETVYFLPRAKEVLAFYITEHNVTNWTDPSLIPDNLPEHQALIKMLGTLEDESVQPE